MLRNAVFQWGTTAGWYLWSCHWSTNHILYNPPSLALPNRGCCICKHPSCSLSFHWATTAWIYPWSMQGKWGENQFCFLFNKCQRQRCSETMRLSPFPVGASWPEVLPRAIGCANRHWARCQHQFNHKLQGEIRGGTRASCPWPTRTPCHQALLITGSAEHLSSAMCYCTASLPCYLCSRYGSHFPDYLQEEKDTQIFHSVYL